MTIDVTTAHPLAPLLRPGRGLATLGTGALGTLIAKLRDTTYERVGNGRRFRAHQRRRTRLAARVGLLVVAGSVAFDAMALQGLGSAGTQAAVSIDIAVFAAVLIGWWALGDRLRHHPELVAWAATIGLAVSTVSTGSLVPSLAVPGVRLPAGHPGGGRPAAAVADPNARPLAAGLRGRRVRLPCAWQPRSLFGQRTRRPGDRLLRGPRSEPRRACAAPACADHELRPARTDQPTPAENRRRHR